MGGFFISLEGVEGAGKSTHALMLAEKLRALGHVVVLTREPGSTAIGKRIREILLDPANGNLDPTAELLLYAADRRQHVAEVIAPALSAGSIVITDRFFDSTRAYQGYGRGLPMELINALEAMATRGVRPHLTLLFDLDVRVGLERNRHARKVDRLELEALEFHERVRLGFLEIAKADPERFKIIEAGMSKEEVELAAEALVMRELSSGA